MNEREELREIFRYYSEKFLESEFYEQLSIVDRMIELYKILYSKEYEYRARYCTSNADGRPKASAMVQEASGNAVNTYKISDEIADKLAAKLSTTARRASK